jgi:signal transduction histidine kinase
MNTLPPAARWYVIGVWLAAALLIPGVLHNAELNLNLIGLMGLCLFLHVAADYFDFSYETSPGNRIVMTVIDAPMIFLAAIIGLPGVFVVIAGSLIVELLHRRVWFKALFNIASNVLTYSAMASIYLLITPDSQAPFQGLPGLVAFVAVALTHYTLNTLIVATVLALSTHQPLLSVYHACYAKIHWIHFATGPFGALAAIAWQANPWLLPLCILPLAMMGRWFKTQTALLEESRRNEALAREAQALANDLRLHQEELVRSSKLAALGTFAAGVGHEFNNLLTGVVGHAELGLLSDDPREKHESLALIARIGTRGRGITSSLLTFARRRELRRVPYPLDSLVEETLMIVEHDLNNEQIAVVRRFEPCPAVLCDPGQITQVLLNLITNASDAMRDQGGGTITIGLASRDDRNDVVDLRVSDTGTGIPAELLDQIFLPFVTTKTSSSGTRSGTGLGLAICHGIIEAHEGTLSVQSTVGCGTTMTVTLPVAAMLAVGTGPSTVTLPRTAETAERLVEVVR